MKNKRWIYLAITSAIIVLGLASRKHGDILPEFIAEYSGDTLWAAMVYCGIRFLFPSLSILKTIVISLLFSYCIEISQLYQADWANTVRNTTLGALIFGHGFLWSDMICYTVGVSLSAVIDSGRIIISQKRNPRKKALQTYFVYSALSDYHLNYLSQSTMKTIAQR